MSDDTIKSIIGLLATSEMEQKKMEPNRIQRKRTKGWRMPENTVSVCRPGKYGNPFIAGRSMLYGNEFITPKDNSEAVELYRKHIKQQLQDFPESTTEALEKIRGKNLACWCKVGAPCHGDVLLEIANERKSII